MGKIDKDGYAHKREWAAKKMSAQRAIATLTEEQHELLEELCGFRHDLHTSWKSAFNSQSSDHERLVDEIDSNSVGLTGEELPCRVERTFGKMPFSPVEIISDLDYDIQREAENIEMGTEEARILRDRLYSETCEQLERINEEIECFLIEIDEKYGTDYAPTGATRL